MRTIPVHVLLMFVGASLSAGVVAAPTAQAACAVVVAGTCGDDCDTQRTDVTCGSNSCTIVILSDCGSDGGWTGSCTVTALNHSAIVDPEPPQGCEGSCDVSVGDCRAASRQGDCAISVGTCNGLGDCLVNALGHCNQDCTINVGACSSAGPGDCVVNLGTCVGTCTVNLDECEATKKCTLQQETCRIGCSSTLNVGRWTACLP